MADHSIWSSPLSARYASRPMQELFSDDKKFRTWRRLWIALAEAEQELGLDITDVQIAQLREHAEDINYDVAKAREAKVRHDVMSHVYAYGQQCPDARGIIHLGATSCYVGDNTDLIVMHEALALLQKKIVAILAQLREFALKYKDMPTLRSRISSRHSPPLSASAQPSGRRICSWTMRRFSTFWTTKSFLDRRERPGHRRASWSCSTAMKQKPVRSTL